MNKHTATWNWLNCWAILPRCRRQPSCVRNPKDLARFFGNFSPFICCWNSHESIFQKAFFPCTLWLHRRRRRRRFCAQNSLPRGEKNKFNGPSWSARHFYHLSFLFSTDNWKCLPRAKPGPEFGRFEFFFLRLLRGLRVHYNYHGLGKRKYLTKTRPICHSLVSGFLRAIILGGAPLPHPPLNSIENSTIFLLFAAAKGHAKNEKNLNLRAAMRNHEIKTRKKNTRWNLFFEVRPHRARWHSKTNELRVIIISFP